MGSLGEVGIVRDLSLTNREIMMSRNECKLAHSTDAERLVLECLSLRRGTFVTIDELCFIAFGIFSGVNDRDTVRDCVIRLAESAGSNAYQRLIIADDGTAAKIS